MDRTYYSVNSRVFVLFHKILEFIERLIMAETPGKAGDTTEAFATYQPLVIGPTGNRKTYRQSKLAFLEQMLTLS